MFIEAFVRGVCGHANVEALHFSFVVWIGSSKFFAFIPDTSREFYDIDVVRQSGLAIGFGVLRGRRGLRGLKQGFKEHRVRLCSSVGGARIKPKRMLNLAVSLSTYQKHLYLYDNFTH